MPTRRQEPDAATLRGALADVQSRGDALVRREAEATAELTEAQAESGRLYGSGADADTIYERAFTITSLRVELDGLANGRALLAAEADALSDRIAAADAREARAALDAAAAALRAAQTTWTEALTALMDGEFGTLHAAVRAAGERTRAAAAVAIQHSLAQESCIEVDYARLWSDFTAALFDALHTYAANADTSAP